MKKTTILMVCLISVSVILLSLLISPKITGDSINLSEHSYTRAICNETNYCQDHEINCDNETVIKINPITGASVQHSSDWQDPREKMDTKDLCKTLPLRPSS